MTWTRVTRRNPCPICRKPDWCEFTPDGRKILCMRVESSHQARGGGWMHPVEGARRDRIFASAAIKSCQPVVLWDKLLAGWQAQQCGELESFSATLGVSRMALESLGCLYAPEHRAFAFPMRNAERDVIGVRLRNDLGSKWAVTGSKQGLFLSGSTVGEETRLGQANRTDSYGADKASHTVERPSHSDGVPVRSVAAPSPAQTLIVEGPTDAAAAIDLGYNVIGRPACLGCDEMIRDVIKKQVHVNWLIIADKDDPGQRGALKLQQVIRRCKIVTLPCKDLREFKNSGGTKEILNALLDAAV